MSKVMTGIYKIENLVNGKVYIGQAVDIITRWRQHKRDYKIKNQIIYRAMRKYGFKNFSFEIIMLCEEDLLNLMEIYYIKQYNSYIHWKDSNGYNMTIGGESTRGRKFTKEVKQKMSRNHPDVSGEKNPMYGRKFTDEHKQKMSIGLKAHYKKFGCKKKPVTEETRRNMSVAQKEYFKTHSAHNKGIPMSEEQKMKLKGRVVSEETRQKLSEANKNNDGKHKVHVIIDNIEFKTMTACAEYIGEKISTLRNWISGDSPMPKEYYDRGLRRKDKQMSDYKIKNGMPKGESHFKSKKVVLDGLVFNCSKECSEYCKIKQVTLLSWLSHTYPMPKEFYDRGLRYLDEPMDNYSFYTRKTTLKKIG